jgi:L-ascorbate metabolism protein UlaG (beta-lactamase superfamily)
VICLRFFGQSCFTIEGNGDMLIFDPFLTGNLAKVAMPDEIHPTYILVSHGHADHIGDTVKLSQDNQAVVITTAEMGHYLAEKGCQNIEPMHIGGSVEFPFGKVKVTPALHGCGIPAGVACGFLVTIEEKTIYFAGDTGLFGDMKLIGDYQKIDYALLPIGDRFTMGPDDAVIAASLLKAKNVIPMHYNGNVRTMQNPQQFAEKLVRATMSKPVIMIPGDTLIL